MHRRGEEKMRIYKVKVNGKTFEVKIMGITETEPVEVKTVKSAVAAPAKAAEAPKAANNAEPKEGEAVKAPMQGTILDVKVKVGDSVKAGANLFILEAMKLENEIKAPRDGKVLEIRVNKGETVNSGDALLILG